MVYSKSIDGSTISLTAQLDAVLADNAQVRQELDDAKVLISEMDNRIHYLESQAYRDSIIAEISNGIVEKILDSIKGTESEIKVTKIFNTENDGKIESLQIGFDDGVVFQAGV